VRGRGARAVKRSRIVAACDYPVLAGIEVRTASEPVLAIRRQVVRLLLARAPDAPVLLELARRLGVQALEPAAPPDGCILCGLCVRVCAEAVGAHALGFGARGSARRVGTPFEDLSPACVGCGACDWICPTAILRQQQAAAEAFRRLPGEERLCRYARLGVVPGALCALSFQCDRCDVEAAMRARFGPEHPVVGIHRAGASGPDGAGGGPTGGGGRG
jgi:predicted molibdopterin-dependent oxidoreductase YjgC